MSQWIIGGLLLLTFSLVGCGGAGGVGGSCRDDRDCPRDGFCCESRHCDGGMCSYKCKVDRDCPNGTACEHDTCLLMCNDDRDCDPGQTCEHGRVCEYD